MDRISTSSKAVDLFGVGKHGWKDGNIAGGITPTSLNAAWFNGAQEELLAVIEGAGQVPAAATLTQLRQAIDIMVRQQSAAVCTAAGTADAITGVFTPVVAALINGLTLYIRSSLANTTATPTFQANATLAKIIVKGNGLALAAGDIAGGGHWIELQYDLVLDKWVLLNPGIATVANDAAAADNSTRLASTGWVRNAMAAIATAAGFSASFTTNGYVKFPSWLGGVIFQWGVSAATSTSVAVSYPIAFPNAVLWLGSQDGGGQPALILWSYTATGLTGFTAYNIASLSKGNAAVLASTAASFLYFSIGR